LEPNLGNEVGNDSETGTLYYATTAVSDDNASISLLTVDGIGEKYHVRGCRMGSPPRIPLLLRSLEHLNNNGCEIDTFTSSGNTSFAIARDLGVIQTTQAPVVWAVGYTTDTAINYTVKFDSSSRSARSPYYKLQYSDDESLVIPCIFRRSDCFNTFFQIVDFLNDFPDAVIKAQQFDQSILQDAASVSDLLGDLVSLALPQVFGSIQLTIGTDLNGAYNESDVMVFMKNVGGEMPR
jgi:Domain of unknown function (DUF5127)